MRRPSVLREIECSGQLKLWEEVSGGVLHGRKYA